MATDLLQTHLGLWYWSMEQHWLLGVK